VLRVFLSFCFALASAGATIYEVGPGQPLSSIGAAPWTTLQPGDEVRIHWRAQPYREKWVLTRQGQENMPITVRGIPGPQGQRPVIEGANAVTAPGLNYWSEDRGILKIGGSNVPADLMPRYLVIDGLEFRGANSGNSFTTDTGGADQYRLNAAGIFVEKGEHITVRNCVFTDNGNGFFVASSDSEPSRDILIQGNHFYGNSNVGRNLEHNTYTAGIGVVYEYNRFGPVKEGAGGGALKDRSAGTVIRYNWIEGGNRQLDLVEGEDSSQIRNDPSYRETYVYGNVLIEPAGAGNRQMVHYGGDNGDASAYRKGVMYFYNNTLVSTRTDRNTMMRISTNDERVDARNNIFYTTLPGSELALLDNAGRLELTNNWIKPGWSNSFEGAGFSGVVTGAATFMEGSDPGFMDAGSQDLRLAPGSPLIDAGSVLPAATAGAHDLLRQYVRHQWGDDRIDPGVLDLGALPLRRSELEPPVLTGVVRAGGEVDLAWTHEGPASGFVVLGLTQVGPHLRWRAAGIVESSERSVQVEGAAGVVGYMVLAYRAVDDTQSVGWPSNIVSVE